MRLPLLPHGSCNCRERGPGLLAALAFPYAPIHPSAWKGNSQKLAALLEPELLRSEGLAEAFPGRLDELGRAYDPFDLGLGAVSPYVVFCEYLPKGHVLLHAGDDVIGDLLLTRGERRAPRASEEPLPEGSLLFAHGDRLVLPNSPTRDELDLTRSQPPYISERLVHRSARKATSANFRFTAFYSGSQCSWPTPQTIGLARGWAA